MKTWKAVFGLGAACAACCAIPLLGLAGGVAAFGAALAACADELLPLAAVLLGLAALLAGAWWWRRRLALKKAGCECSTSCSTEASCARY